MTNGMTRFVFQWMAGWMAVFVPLLSHLLHQALHPSASHAGDFVSQIASYLRSSGGSMTCGKSGWEERSNADIGCA